LKKVLVKRSVAGVLLLIAAAGCASAGEERPAVTPSAAPAAKRVPASELEALAVKTLSEHLSIPAQSIEVVSITPIEWRDSSLGCPRPDFSYMQVITPGHLAVLRHGEATYQVHMAGKRAFVCERAPGAVAKQVNPKPQVVLTLEHMQALARADLARRLGVSADKISIESTKPVVWQDLSLGCPQPGQSYKAGPVEGNVLSLVYGGRTYTYHADRYRVLPCPPFQED
jgi:hypothetical protein